VAVGVAAPLARHRLKLAPPVVTALSFSAPPALALAHRRTKLRDAGIYALQMWAYYAHYDMPDDDPDALLRRTRVSYPATADELIGLGEAPTLRLQRALGRPGRIRPHDVALSCVHWSWFFVPHGTLAFMLLRHHDRFVRSALMMTGTFDIGLLFYWGLPTAPPWWAGEKGRIAPVRRIMVETGARVWKGAWNHLYDGLEGNPFAAMPSLHFGTSVMAARLLGDVGPRHAAAGWAYALTLGFGLVYLGEHYVIDLVAGGALAESVYRFGPKAAPAINAAARSIQRLEPGAG
jgi:membrane-associated phospholipid phosphatase